MAPAPRSTAESAPRRVAPRRDFAALEERRMRAGRCSSVRFQADVARSSVVSRETASQWARRVPAWRHRCPGRRRTCGAAPQALRHPTRRGRAGALERPRANGFPTELWTLARVASVIERLTGVGYSTTQTWVILRERLGWSRQRPARKALESNDEAITAWARDRWPVVKKTPDAGARGSSSKTSRVSASSPR